MINVFQINRRNWILGNGTAVGMVSIFLAISIFDSFVRAGTLETKMGLGGPELAFVKGGLSELYKPEDVVEKYNLKFNYKTKSSTGLGRIISAHEFSSILEWIARGLPEKENVEDSNEVLEGQLLSLRNELESYLGGEQDAPDIVRSNFSKIYRAKFKNGFDLLGNDPIYRYSDLMTYYENLEISVHLKRQFRDAGKTIRSEDWANEQRIHKKIPDEGIGLQMNCSFDNGAFLPIENGFFRITESQMSYGNSIQIDLKIGNKRLARAVKKQFDRVNMEGKNGYLFATPKCFLKPVTSVDLKNLTDTFTFEFLSLGESNNVFPKVSPKLLQIVGIAYSNNSGVHFLSEANTTDRVLNLADGPSDLSGIAHPVLETGKDWNDWYQWTYLSWDYVDGGDWLMEIYLKVAVGNLFSLFTVNTVQKYEKVPTGIGLVVNERAFDGIYVESVDELVKVCARVIVDVLEQAIPKK